MKPYQGFFCAIRLYDALISLYKSVIQQPVEARAGQKGLDDFELLLVIINHVQESLCH